MAGNSAISVCCCGGQGEGILDGFDKLLVAEWAIINGQAGCLRVISKYRLHLDGFISQWAAEIGNLSMLRLAHELGDRCLTLRPATLVAASRGRFEQPDVDLR